MSKLQNYPISKPKNILHILLIFEKVQKIIACHWFVKSKNSFKGQRGYIRQEYELKFFKYSVPIHKKCIGTLCIFHLLMSIPF